MRPVECNRILIVRLSAIGDVVHTLPALATLHRKLPGAFLGWAVDDRAAPLLFDHPLINRLHVLPVTVWERENWSIARRWKALRQFGSELAHTGYDVTLDFQGLSKSAYLAFLSRTKKRIGFAGNRESREISAWLNNIRIRVPDEISHIVHRNLALLESLLGEPVALTGDPKKDFPIKIPDQDHTAIAEFWRKNGWANHFCPVFIYPFSTWVTKVYPHAQVIAVAKLLRKRILGPVLIGWGGPQEGEQAKQIVAAVNEECPNSAVCAPRTSLTEQAALIERCTVVIGPDTAAIHTAAALGIPVVSWFGASDPRRNRPYGANHRVLTVKDLTCRPCWEKKCRLVPEKLACLKRISSEQVVEAILDQLALFSKRSLREQQKLDTGGH